MGPVKKRTFSVSTEQSEYIDSKIASGGYASGSEVVREGLRALQERDAAMEKWLRQEVLPAYEEYLAEPSSALPIDEAFEDVLSDPPAREQRRAG